MSYEPPIPEAASSPFPLRPAPLGDTADAQTSSAPVTRPDAGTAGADDSFAGRARERFDRVKESRYGLGAAIGIGSAALLAAVLFARRGKAQPPPVAAARTRRKAKAGV